MALGLIASAAGCSSDAAPASESEQQSIAATPSPSPPAPSPADGGDYPYLPPAFGGSDATGGGHWWGTMSRDGQVVNFAMCLVTEVGNLACILTDTDDGIAMFDPAHANIRGAVHGFVHDLNTGQAYGSGKFHATPGNVISDGKATVADFEISGGVLKERNSILELTMTSLGEEHTFTGRYDHYYRVVAGTAPVNGVYTTFDIYGDVASLSIDQSGTLFLQSASGCAGGGQVTGTGPTYNAHKVGATVSNCPGLDGNYVGLATLLDFSWVNGTDNLLIMLFGETTAIVAEAVK